MGNIMDKDFVDITLWYTAECGISRKMKGKIDAAATECREKGTNGSGLTAKRRRRGRKPRPPR